MPRSNSKSVYFDATCIQRSVAVQANVNNILTKEYHLALIKVNWLATLPVSEISNQFNYVSIHGNVESACLKLQTTKVFCVILIICFEIFFVSTAHGRGRPMSYSNLLTGSLLTKEYFGNQSKLSRNKTQFSE